MAPGTSLGVWTSLNYRLRGSAARRHPTSSDPFMPDTTGWQRLRELSEESLRTKVMLPLLAATPGLHRISDVHGRNEKGLAYYFR